MSQKIMLIINPISGTGNKDGLDSMVVQRVGSLGFDVDVKYTTCRGDATRLAKMAIDAGYKAVLAAGGDGTINETARALCNTNTALGIIPAGSGNGLARHIGIPIDPGFSLNVIEEMHVEDVDYCTVNGAEFFCTMGVGFDAAVGHRFAAQRRRGLMMYVKSAIEEYKTFKPGQFTLSINGEILTREAFVVAVANASQYGNNAYISPRASITDGLLDVTVIHPGNPLATARMGLDMMTGYLNKNMLVETFRAPAVTIYRSEGGEAHIDGEPVMLGDILDVKCHRHALKVLTPSCQSDFKPLLTPISSMGNAVKIKLHHLFHGRKSI